MTTTNAPKYVIRECDEILNGELKQTDAQFRRWVVVQLKKLAQQASARHLESAQIRNKVKHVERFAKGGFN